MTTTASTYQTRDIDAAVAAELRNRDDAGRQPRVVATPDGGDFLRCCLRRSRPGEPVALVSYAPLRRWARETGADPGAYEEVGPVFIHGNSCDGPTTSGFPADVFDARRVLRAYNADGKILGGRLVKTGERPAELIEEMFADPQIAFVHVRALEFGCYWFEARRGMPPMR